jgi:hypothetical protein
MKGLIVKQPWIDKILSGAKTWELRGSSTSNFGEIALIQSGSGQVVGICDLVGVEGPLTMAELRRSTNKHGVDAKEFGRKPLYAKTFAWVLENARRFDEPVPYRHPQGAVIWVNLSRRATARIRSSDG